MNISKKILVIALTSVLFGCNESQEPSKNTNISDSTSPKEVKPTSEIKVGNSDIITKSEVLENSQEVDNTIESNPLEEGDSSEEEVKYAGEEFFPQEKELSEDAKSAFDAVDGKSVTPGPAKPLKQEYLDVAETLESQIDEN